MAMMRRLTDALFHTLNAALAESIVAVVLFQLMAQVISGLLYLPLHRTLTGMDESPIPMWAVQICNLFGLMAPVSTIVVHRLGCAGTLGLARQQQWQPWSHGTEAALFTSNVITLTCCGLLLYYQNAVVWRPWIYVRNSVLCIAWTVKLSWSNRRVGWMHKIVREQLKGVQDVAEVVMCYTDVHARSQTLRKQLNRIKHGYRMPLTDGRELHQWAKQLFVMSETNTMSEISMLVFGLPRSSRQAVRRTVSLCFLLCMAQKYGSVSVGFAPDADDPVPMPVHVGPRADDGDGWDGAAAGAHEHQD